MNTATHPMLGMMESIREALLRGEEEESVAGRLGTTLQAVRVIRKGLGNAVPAADVRPSWTTATSAGTRPAAAGQCPWSGRFAVVDGANVAGWGGQRKGEPRLAQVLAICRYFSENGVRFACRFDANFRWCLKRHSERDADVLDQVFRNEPQLFRQSPAGQGPTGETIKADPFVLRDAESETDGLIVSNDLYRREAAANPEAFGWVLREPWRFIRGDIAPNGDVVLGAGGEVRIPVREDPEFYIR